MPFLIRPYRRFLSLAAERRCVKWQRADSIISLKDEIEKLIQAEQTNLENHYSKDDDFGRANVIGLRHFGSS